jgi:hypothetical protein
MTPEQKAAADEGPWTLSDWLYYFDPTDEGMGDDRSPMVVGCGSRGAGRRLAPSGHHRLAVSPASFSAIPHEIDLRKPHEVVSEPARDVSKQVSAHT